MADLVICLRHGEKPSNAEHPCDAVRPGDKDGPGFDERGHEDPHSLTIRGWQRAGALAGTYLCGQLRPIEKLPPVTFLVPRYVHKTTGRDESARHRPYQTVYELARRFGIVPSPVRDPDDKPNVHADHSGYVGHLYQQIMDFRGIAVVCWEHKGLVKLAERLTPRLAPHEWPADGFDAIWRFQRGRLDPTYDFEPLHQDVLEPAPTKTTTE